MKSLRIKLMGLALAASFLAVPVLSQPGKLDRKALKSEIKTLVNEEILPFMQEQRQKLDAKLTAEEKARLQSLRTELKSLRENHRETRHQRREQGEGFTPSPGDLQIHREQQRTHRQLMQQAWAIADRHQATLDEIYLTVEPKRQEWHQALKAIADKYPEALERPRPANGQEGEPAGHHPHGKKGRKMLMGKIGRLTMSGPHADVHFLLWDGEAPEEREKGENSRPALAFPNPVGGSFTISYELQQPGEVQITLLKRSGEVVKEVAAGNQAAGSHETTVEVADLPKGMYFYRLATPDGSVTKRFLKE